MKIKAVQKGNNKDNDFDLIIKERQFSKSPGNRKKFEVLFNIYCDKIDKIIDIKEKNEYIYYAKELIRTFHDNVHKINDLDVIKKAYDFIEETIKKENDLLLNKIDDEVKKLENETRENEFDNIVINIQSYDSCVFSDSLDSNQKKRYGELTEKCEAIITSKKRREKYQKYKDYNIKYLSALKDCIDDVKKIRKNSDDIIKKICGVLLNVDESKVFDETMTYYSYVYNYVFAELKDQQKYDFINRLIESKSSKKTN